MMSPSNAGIQQTAVSALGAVLNLAATIGVLDVELDVALPQVLALEGVVLRMLVSDAQTSPLAANRQRALGEERTEALAAAAEGSERRVIRVGESARGRAERERRQQRHDLLVELLRRLQLLRARLEVCGVAGYFGRAPRGKHDGVAEQVRQDFRERQPPFLADRRLRHEQAERRRDRDAIDPLSHVRTLLRASYGCRAPVNPRITSDGGGSLPRVSGNRSVRALALGRTSAA